MRSLSLRGWLLLVSVLFTVLVVGGIALTTYIIVSDGMKQVAFDTTLRLAETASSVFEQAVGDSTMPGSSASRLGAAAIQARLRDAGLGGADYALYGPDGELIWSSPGTQREVRASSPARLRALEESRTTTSFLDRGGLFRGLFGRARLQETIVHRPVVLEAGRRGVLDVAYVPLKEERIINAIRLPMGILAASAMVIMVVLMQTSMAWVLNLVDELRRAADSIDAGRLDERLPDQERNEIGELARSINRLIERLQRRADAQSRFVADASHELATPVAGIRGYTSILRAWGGEDAKVRSEAIDAIDRESKRMARLTNDLLNLLHADQGLRLKSQRFDLNVLARERLATTASRYLDKDIEFVGPEDESLQMVGDPERIEDVLSILLDNAGKYTPPGGRVQLQTARRRESVNIIVTDTGPGISPEALSHIFDRFFRSDAARSEGEGGFGLGLAIAKSIITSMGGTIEADSEVGKGTTFLVVVPRGRL